KLIDVLRNETPQTNGVNQAVARIFQRDRMQNESNSGGSTRAARGSSPSENNFGLTKRELQIVGALVQGQTNKDIAATFGVSEYTLKHHLPNVFDKLGVYSRLELVLFAISHQLCVGADDAAAPVTPARSTASSTGNAAPKK